MGKRKQNVQLTIWTRWMDGMVFVGFATGIAGVIALLGYAILANLT